MSETRHYLQGDSAIVASNPPVNPHLDLPSFGAVPLKPAQRYRWEDENGTHEIKVIDEREAFLEKLYQTTNEFRTGAFLIGTIIYVLGISVNQWLRFEGAVRKAIWALKENQNMRQFVKPGEEIFDQSPRKKSAMNAMKIVRGKLEGKEEWSWLQVKDFSMAGTMMATWYDGLWDALLKEQGKFISNHAEDIKNDGKGRVDQVVSFDFARSDIGELVLDRTFNEDGTTVLKYGIKNVKKDLMPASFRRPTLKEFTIRLINQYETGDIRRRPQQNEDRSFVVDENGLQVYEDRRRPPKTCSISIKALDKIKVPDLPAEGSPNLQTQDRSSRFMKLRHAIEVDLDVNLMLDGLVIAWENPLNFWGQVNRLCRIRTESEFEVVMETLRSQHMVSDDDEATIFLFVAAESKVVSSEEHPTWPGSYYIDVEATPRKTAKRALGIEPASPSPRTKKSKE